MPAPDPAYFVVLGAQRPGETPYTVAEFPTASATAAATTGASWCRTVRDLLDQQEGIEQRSEASYTDRIIGFTIERHTKEDGTDDDWTLNGGLSPALLAAF